MSALSSLPKERFVNDGTIGKARAMLRQGKSEDYVSDYLGMDLNQVRGLRVTNGVRGRPPIRRADPRHVSAYSGDFEPIRSVSVERHAAEIADNQFQVALFRYGAEHGLPNLSRLQCLSELRVLVNLREDELALAEKLTAEMSLPVPPKPVRW